VHHDTEGLDALDEDEDPQVEFEALAQEGVSDVFLHYHLGSGQASIFDHCFDDNGLLFII